MSDAAAARLPVRIGHATHPDDATGCTVIIFDQAAVGGVDVRGPAPESRETPLLAPDTTVARVDALVFCGGSAFGLACADGVMRYLGERGVGHPTPARAIPIVPASVIYDLLVGEPTAPDAEMGHTACLTATAPAPMQGSIGAGVGATVGKWGGFEHMMMGGFGWAATTAVGPEGQQAAVAAAAVVNAVGDVVDAQRQTLAGARSSSPGAGSWLAGEYPTRWRSWEPPSGTNTTLVAVLTDALLDKVEASRLAQRAHNGLAPSHSPGAHLPRRRYGLRCFLRTCGCAV